MSGLPIGIALIVMPPKARLAAFAVMVCLDTGHTIAPIAAAWMNRGFRQLMRTELARFILLPALMLAASGLIGFATQAGWTGYDLRSPHQMFRITDFKNPFPVFCWLYWIWNIYHFGMQNFGVVRLYRRGRGSRNLCLVLWTGITAFCMGVLPILANPMWLFLVMTGVISVNHWLVEIGMTSRISGRPWLFPFMVLAFGAIAFIWTVPTPIGNMVRMLPVWLSLRFGLGMVHFLYDRWIYQLSNPQVRAIIRRDVLCPASISCAAQTGKTQWVTDRG